MLGSVVAADILLFMQTDGWNHLGAIKSVSEDQNIPDTACTANCRPYSDTTGYQPRNNPWEVSDPAGWQPLIETDGNGFFFRLILAVCAVCSYGQRELRSLVGKKKTRDAEKSTPTRHQHHASVATFRSTAEDNAFFFDFLFIVHEREDQTNRLYVTGN